MTAAVQENDSGRKGIALGISIALHALLILFFVLYKIITPIPPFPEKEGGGAGYELALGFSELGMGDNPEVTDPSTPASTQEASAPPEQEAEVLTSEVDENDVATPPRKDDKPRNDKPKVKPKPTPEEIAREKQRKINELMGNKGSGSGGQGASDQPGDAGGANGSPTGTGIGNGTGSYKGDGWSVDLAGRTIKRKPVIDDKPSKAGKVVMNIWVDPGGKVVRADQNQVLSTTLEPSLVTIARRAALESNFYPDPKASGDKKGTMTFVFVLD
jgi:outer membrane biosynthesis protein TonB